MQSGNAAFRFVMIEHDHLRAARADFCDLGGRSSPAINRDEELWPVCLPAAFDPLALSP